MPEVPAYQDIKPVHGRNGNMISIIVTGFPEYLFINIKLCKKFGLLVKLKKPVTFFRDAIL